MMLKCAALLCKATKVFIQSLSDPDNAQIYRDSARARARHVVPTHFPVRYSSCCSLTGDDTKAVPFRVPPTRRDDESAVFFAHLAYRRAAKQHAGDLPVRCTYVRSPAAGSLSRSHGWGTATNTFHSSGASHPQTCHCFERAVKLRPGLITSAEYREVVCA